MIESKLIDHSDTDVAAAGAAAAAAFAAAPVATIIKVVVKVVVVNPECTMLKLQEKVILKK